MAPFRIQPIVRLQNWVAGGHGFFGDEGLECGFECRRLGGRQLGQRFHVPDDGQALERQGVDVPAPRQPKLHPQRPRRPARYLHKSPGGWLLDRRHNAPDSDRTKAGRRKSR
jgi:hypothetical protein